MFPGPKGYIAKICEVHLQYGNRTTNGRFTLFSSKFHSNVYFILFGFSGRNKKIAIKKINFYKSEE